MCIRDRSIKCFLPQRGVGVFGGSCCPLRSAVQRDTSAQFRGCLEARRPCENALCASRAL
eukprot:7337556-Alexandrium_andersonii.AAC.1